MATNLEKWKIGVISTAYDLQETRANVIRMLDDLGFEPIAFESPTMPVEPGVHSHDACVKVVELADIIVLLMDRRYGGLYLGKGPESITEKEFEAAYSLRKIIVPCATRELFNARHTVKTSRLSQDQSRNGSGSNRGSKRGDRVVDDRTINFLDRVIHKDRDQYLIIYESTDDLLKRLVGRLQGLSRFICSQLIERQTQAVDSMKTVSGLFPAIGDLSACGTAIEPPFRVAFGRTRRRRAIRVIQIAEEESASVLITGKPGTGKSLLLALAFREHARHAVRNCDWTLPFFVRLRGRGIHYHFCVHRYMTEAFEEYMGRDGYPLLDLGRIRPVFYMDGLDEGAAIPTRADVSCLESAEMLRRPFALTCRTAYAQRTIDLSASLGSKFAVHLQLGDWTKPQALEYLARVRARAYPGAALDRLVSLIKRGSDDSPIVASPLLLALTALLCILDPDEGLPSLEAHRIYEWLTHRWVAREIERYREEPISPIRQPEAEKTVHRCWNAAAWIIYRDRQCGRETTLEALKREIGSSDAAAGEAIDSPVFQSLLSISVFRNVVTGMFHEQLLEFLVARAFVEACQEGGARLRERLSLPLAASINGFIKEIWQGAQVDDLSRTITHLHAVCLASIQRANSRNRAQAANSVYFISRVPLPSQARGALESLLGSATDLFTRNGVLWGLVRLGSLEHEDLLYRELSSNPEAAALNRALHLEYFGDTVARAGIATVGMRNWAGTLSGLTAHIRKNDLRFVYSRRLDLFTIRTLMEANELAFPMTRDHLKEIRMGVDALERSANAPDLFRRRVQDELSNLETAFARYEKDA